MFAQGGELGLSHAGSTMLRTTPWEASRQLLRDWSWVFPAAALSLSIVWLASFYPQPLVYDASQYVALGRQIEWVGPVPVLVDGGIRTYAYPLLVRLFVGESPVWLYVVQSAAIVGLVVALRRRLFPPSIGLDVIVSVLCVAVPVLSSYAVVVLSDLVGAVALCGGLLLLATCPTRIGWGRVWCFAWSGLLVGVAVQLRPAYAQFAGFLLAIGLAGFVWDGLVKRPWRWARVAGIAAGLAGFGLASTPTVMSNAREHGEFGVLPTEGMDRLAGYQLMLGLSLDRWSSNPPPIADRNKVAETWQKRGWSMVPQPPYRSPRTKDFVREARSQPVWTLWQCCKHVYFAFEKWEILPYSGRLPWTWNCLVWIANWAVLGLGSWEAIRLCRWGEGVTRRFAMLHVCLIAYLVATCALVVAEERFSLAAYPASLLFAGSWLANRTNWNVVSHFDRLG